MHFPTTSNKYFNCMLNNPNEQNNFSYKLKDALRHNYKSAVPNMSTLAILICQGNSSQMPFGIPRMNFPEFLGSAVS